MRNIKNNPDAGSLRRLYDAEPAARVILDEFAGRERNRSESKVDNLLYLKVDNRPITRGEIIRFFHELEDIGCGTFVVGRKGHASRFRWAVGLPSVGRAASGEHVPLEAISEEEQQLADDADLETYAFPLRPNLKIELALPMDLTLTEAARLADFIKALPFDRKSTEQS